MYAIASLLDPIIQNKIRDLWSRFEAKCGLTGIKNQPLPHFTWMAADSCHYPSIEEFLANTADKMPVFTVRAAGIGIFTGLLPVVYINLVKDRFLIEWHSELWLKMRPFMIGPNPYYHPERWIPHITLAYHENDYHQLGCAVLDIAYQPIDFTFSIDNLAIITQTDDPTQNGLRNKYMLHEDNS